MKKALWMVLALVVVAGAVFFGIRWWRMRTFAERVFPADTILFVSLPDVQRAGEEFAETDLGKALAASPRRDVYRRQGERLAQSIESLVGADLRPLFEQFTRDAAAGIFPLPGGHRGLGIAAYVDSPGEAAKFIEQKLDPGWRRREPDLVKTPVTAGALSYYKYSSKAFPESFQPCYAVLEHHLLVANNEDSFHRLLDSRDGRSEPLRGNALLKEARGRVDYRHGLLFFLNVQAAREALEKQLPARARLLWPELLRASGLGSVKYLAGTTEAADGGFRSRGFAGIPEPAGMVKVLLEQKPVRLQGPAFVPPSARFFSAGTLPDFARMDQEGGPNWTRAWLLLQALTGVDLRGDFLETLGGEFLLYSTEPAPAESNGILAPKTVVALSLKDPARFAKSLDRLASAAQSRGILRDSDTYRNRQLYRFTLPFGVPGLAPAYFVEGSWFRGATDTDALKLGIDALDQKAGLTAGADFRNAASGFPADVNLLTYTSVSSVLRSTAALLQQSGAGNPWIHEYGLDQELEYLAGKLPGAASCGRVQDGGFYFASRSPVPAGFLALPPVAAALTHWIGVTHPSWNKY